MNKIYLFFFVFFSLISNSYAAELTSSMKQTMAHDPIGTSSLINLVFSMVFVIALIYATGWVYSKLNIINKGKLKNFSANKTDKTSLSILQSVPLGQQRHLYSVEMCGKIMLIGSTPNSINLIQEFDIDQNDNDCHLQAQNEDVSDIKRRVVKKSFKDDVLCKKYKD